MHWIALDSTTDLNNEVAFSVPVHNLLTRKGEVDSPRQELRNRSASFQASPQAARMKRLTRLDKMILRNPEVGTLISAQENLKEGGEGSLFPPTLVTSPPGSISQPVARSRLDYV